MNAFHYECPKCEHRGLNTDLFAGRLCPDCKTDYFSAKARQELVNDAIGQTIRRAQLIVGNFCVIRGEVNYDY